MSIGFGSRSGSNEKIEYVSGLRTADLWRLGPTNVTHFRGCDRSTFLAEYVCADVHNSNGKRLEVTDDPKRILRQPKKESFPLERELNDFKLMKQIPDMRTVHCALCH